MKTNSASIAVVLLVLTGLVVLGLYALRGGSEAGQAALASAGPGSEQEQATELVQASDGADGRAALVAPSFELGIPMGVRRTGAGLLVGRVLERASGAPVGGLRVDLSPLPPGGPEVWQRVLGLFAADLDMSEYIEPVATTASDAGGSFQFEGVAAGEYFIQAWGTHHVPDVVTRARVISTGAGGPLDVYVRGGGRVVGVVVDGANRPVRGARVVVMPAVGSLFESLRAGTLCSLEARTDGEGAFAVAGVPPGNEWEVTVTGPRMALTQVDGIEVRAGADTEVRVEAQTGGVLVGRVVAVPEEGGAPLPVAGAQVGALPRGLRSLPFAREVLERTHALTDEQGRYRMTGIPAGEVDLLGFAVGLVPAKGPSLLVTTSQETVAADFLLERGLVVRGRVIDTMGVPVPDVLVRWQVVEDQMEFDFSFGPLLVGALDGLRFPTTDAEGRFTAGAFRGSSSKIIEFEKQGYGTTRSFWDGKEQDLEVVLPGLGTLEGVVMDAVAHTPVTSFSVEIEGNSFSGADFLRDALGQGELQEHPGGRFSLQTRGSQMQVKARVVGSTDLPFETEGEVDLTFRAPGYLSAEIGDLKVREGETVKGVIVEMYPGGVVRGRVTDTAGAPVPGAQVFSRLLDPAPDRPGRGARDMLSDLPGGFTPYAASMGLLAGGSVLSGPDGAFEMIGVEPGRLMLVAVHRSYTLGSSEPFDVSLEGPPAEVALVLDSGGVIHGEVSDRHGRPIPKAVVLAVSPSNFGGGSDSAPRGGFFEGRADAAGRYRIEHVDAGVYFLVMARGDSVLSPTSLLGSLNFNLVTVARGEEVEYDIIDASAGGTRVFGRVMASDMQVTRGQVMAMGFESESLLGFDLKLARIAPDGSFEFEGLTSGEYQLRLEGLGEDVDTIQLRVDIPDVPEYRLDLRVPDGRIEGRVTDAVTGEPLAGIRVRAHSSERVEAQGLVGQMMGDDTGEFSDWTDDEGRYEFGRLAAAEYELVAGTKTWRAHDHTVSQPLAVKLREDEVRREVDFQLEPARGVEVLVLDEAGRPVPNARVGARHTERPDDVLGSAFAGEDGLCVVRGLVAGTYDLTAGHEEFADARLFAVPLDPGVSERIEMRMVRGVAVSVLVLGTNGRPVSGGAGRLVPVEGDAGAEALLKSMLDGSGVSDGEGLLELGRYEPGEYLLEVRRGLAEYRQEVTLPPGGSVRLEARLR